MALASVHPVAPVLAVVAVAAWAAVSAAFPRVWWVAVPALLPVLDASPWTGLLLFDEFDLFLLATLAGGWLRAASGGRGNTRSDRKLGLALVLVAASASVALVRGTWGGEPGHLGLFQGYADPLNSLRVGKSLVFVLLFTPMVHRGLHDDRPGALGRLCLGVWVGVVLVAAAVVAERMAFPGLFDFSRPYRTTAMFWEMHVGGAAIDAYAALCAPFVAWAVWSARSAAARVAAALLTLAWAYVCLTTFSRGVWLAVPLSLCLLAGAVWAARLRRELRWRLAGDALLVFALLAEIGAVAATGSFMGERLTKADRDLSSRLGHWHDGLRLLHSPVDWAVGIGSGRLPARYAAETPRREFSGGLSVKAGAPGEDPDHATLAGPRSQAALAGLFAMTQRVPLRPGARYTADFSARTAADAEITVAVCEMHLLYARRCQVHEVIVHATTDGRWQRLHLPLSGPSLDPGRWFAPRSGVFALTVNTVGGLVDLTDMALYAGSGMSTVRNPRFANGLAGWFPLAQSYFLPWHIDNFLLETLIERGVFGVLASGGLVALALSASLRVRPGAEPVAPFLGAAIVGVLLVGSLSSVQDVPRVAFGFWLLVIVARAQLSTTPATQDSVYASTRFPADIVPAPRHLPPDDRS